MASSSNSQVVTVAGRSPGQPRLRPDSVGFDFDGVIADIGEAFIRLACDRYNYCSIRLEDINSFQVENCTDIPRTIVENIFDEILQDSLGTGLKPMDGALPAIARLRRVADVTIITARPLHQPVQDWFDHHCRDSDGNGGAIRIVVTGDHDNKEGYIRECGLHHFIDDRTLTCEQLFAAGLSPIVYTQPWNRDQHNLPTVAGWDEILELFDLD